MSDWQERKRERDRRNSAAYRARRRATQSGKNADAADDFNRQRADAADAENVSAASARGVSAASAAVSGQRMASPEQIAALTRQIAELAATLSDPERAARYAENVSGRQRGVSGRQRGARYLPPTGGEISRGAPRVGGVSGVSGHRSRAANPAGPDWQFVSDLDEPGPGTVRWIGPPELDPSARQPGEWLPERFREHELPDADDAAIGAAGVTLARLELDDGRAKAKQRAGARRNRQRRNGDTP